MTPITRLAPPLLAVLLLLSACKAPGTAGGPKNNLDAPPPKTTALSVKTVTAQPGTLSVQRSASAIIQAQRDSNVAAQSSGTVQQVYADEGQEVQAGQVIVQLDDTPQRQALENARLQVQQAQVNLAQTRTNTSQATAALSAAVQSAEANLSQAQQSAQSAENLFKVGGTSLTSLQNARSQLAQAQSQLATARNNLAQNGRSAQGSVPLQQVQLQSAQASVRQAEQNLARTAIRAPFSGVIAKMNAKVGEFAAQGNPAFRLVDPGSLRAKFSVPTSDAAALADGTRLNLSYSGANYVATVVGSPGIAGSDRLVPITARVQGGSALPVGGTARISYRARLGQGVLIPSSAVQADGGENAVYLASGNTAQRQVISVIAEANGQMAVTGLNAGAPVINPVPASLQDGARIQVDQ